MEVDGHAEVTTSLVEQADKAADASMEALDPHTGELLLWMPFLQAFMLLRCPAWW